MKLLSQLNAEGTTIVMVTHSQTLDATYADRIINLFDGQNRRRAGRKTLASSHKNEGRGIHIRRPPTLTLNFNQ